MGEGAKRKRDYVCGLPSESHLVVFTIDLCRIWVELGAIIFKGRLRKLLPPQGCSYGALTGLQLVR